MIRTTNQLSVVRKRMAELEKDLGVLALRKDQMDPMEYRIQEAGLLHLLKTMNADIEEFMALTNEDLRSYSLSFDIVDLPKILIKARLVRKMSQSDLAKKIGVEPQQIQRYESNDYEGVSFARMMEIREALVFDTICHAGIHEMSGG